MAIQDHTLDAGAQADGDRRVKQEIREQSQGQRRRTVPAQARTHQASCYHQHGGTEKTTPPV